MRLDPDDLTPVDAFTGPSPSRVAHALRAGECPSDRAFDSFLPVDLRARSADYWTPLVVAVEAARWLDEFGVRTVVDVGAGPGKFCITGALAGQCQYVGVEHHPRLVDIAQRLARQFGVTGRVRFASASLDALPATDAYYLYNPFAENLMVSGTPLADDIELRWKQYSLEVSLMQREFRRAPAGTLVLTYNGFGGRMPASYDLIRLERNLPCVLRMWRKSRSGDDGAFSGTPDDD